MNNSVPMYQIRTISKLIEKMMEIDFSNIAEIKELRKQLIEGVRENINFHMDMHTIDLEFHDCKEYESRNTFGGKMLTIIDETIRELEDASRN